MLKTVILAPLLVGVSCTFGCHRGDSGTVDSTEATPDSLRKTVQTQAVAAYDQRLNTALDTNWFFSVQLYETTKRKVYQVQMIFEEMHELDTVRFPDLGYPIKPAILKGPDSLTCFIGFLDPKGQFMYYKSVYVDKGTLNIRTVRRYKLHEGD